MRIGNENRHPSNVFSCAVYVRGLETLWGSFRRKQINSWKSSVLERGMFSMGRSYIYVMG